MTRPKRKAIPRGVKTLVLILQHGQCAHCHRILGDTPTQFDHRPALSLRKLNDDRTDYEPPQLSHFYIEALHKPCHLERTVGRKRDAEKTVTTKGSDAWLRKKFNRLANPKKKRKIKSRGFAKGKRKFPKRSKHVKG